MKNIRLSALALAASALASVALLPAASAADGNWMIRARVLNLDPANKGSTNPDLDLSVNSKVFPEVDVSYFFTPNIAAELILTYPQKHDIRAGGDKIGTVKHLPPTLTLQYHFTDLGAFKPYVGAGLNYTVFSDVDFDPAVNTLLKPSIDSDSVGWALQIGFDYALTKDLYLNVDLKKVKIGTDVKSFGTKIGDFKIDPTLFGIGLGWRF